MESPLYELEKTNEYRELVSSKGDLVSSLMTDIENGEKQPTNFSSCKHKELSNGEDLKEPLDLSMRQRAVEYEFEQAVKRINNTARQKLANDEGYNSHSSGESAPLLIIPSVSKQDEAGYEIPDIIVKVDEKCSTNKNKKSIANFWKRYSSDNKETDKNEDQDNYYDTQSGSLHSYFLPHSRCSCIRFLVCFIFAVAIATSLLLMLYLIARIDIVFCFVLSVIVFLLSLVMSVTLSKRHALCTATLLLPSLFSSRAKLGILAFMLFLLIIGPAIRIADKLNVARTCRIEAHEPHLYKNEMTLDYEILNSKVYEKCSDVFQHIKKFCHKMLSYYRQSCATNSVSLFDNKLCNLTDEYLCGSNSTIIQKCSMKTSLALSYKSVLGDFRTTNNISRIIIYMMPFLSLLLFSEAYRYNRGYLTKKDEDNIYITPMMKCLDRERKNRGLNDPVIPLTRIEFQTYLIRRSLALSRREWFDIVKWFFIASGCSLFVLIVILLEDLISSALESVLQGQCKYNYDYYVANQHREVIYGMLGFLALLIVFQGYALRLRSVICDYFYVDVVDIRSKHLYYKILHDRQSFSRHIRRKIQLLSEEKRLAEKISFSTKVFELLPQRGQNLCLKLSVRSCMVCDSLTYYKTVECKQLSCKAHYCFECFVDAGQSCLACNNSISNNKSKPRGSTDSVAV